MSIVTFPPSIIAIHIFNMAPPTAEIPYALLEAIKNVHPYPDKINIVNNYFTDNDKILYILICPGGYPFQQPLLAPMYYIAYQLEPSTSHVMNNQYYLQFLKGALYNWDYSRQNISLLTQKGINMSYVPPGYTNAISNIDKYVEEEKDIDVSFLGWDIHPRRQIIKNQLLSAGLNIYYSCSLNITQMQDIIRRSKVCLNYRSLDNNTCLETVRLNSLLSNQACIVNEEINDKELDIYQNNLITVPYDKLAETCVDLVKDPVKRAEQARKSYEWYKHNRQWHKIVDFNYLLPSLL
jgi:hypothetical protein